MVMKTNLMHPIGKVFHRRWTLPIQVAGAWTTIVTVYVLGGLRPHGYIGNETEALSTWLGWVAGGGILLAWVMRKFLFDTSSWLQTRMGRLHAHAQASGDEVIDASAQGHAYSCGECGLRMGVAGFGYYCGTVKTDDD
jgi:hypothetical protein